MTIRRGRELIQLPGPTNIPERVLRAMARPACDFAAPEFVALARSCIEDLKAVFQTTGEVFAYSANGHGVWEVALANLVAAGERVLIPDTGRFSLSWKEMAEALGVEVVDVPTDLRHPVAQDDIQAALELDRGHRIKAVMMVQVETSTGMLHDVSAARRALDAARHPALLVVDAIASTGCIDLPMDAWDVDVVLTASQKGLMLPPGLAFVAAGPKALAAARSGGALRKYWDWQGRTGPESYMWFYGTPPIQMVYGLRESLDMLLEEGLPGVFARHSRLAEAARRAVARWATSGALEFQVVPPAARSDTVTCIRFVDPHQPDALRQLCRERLSVAFGAGLGRLQGRALRIGHLGDLNEPMILGALGALEAGMRILGVPHGDGALAAAAAHLAEARRER